MSGLTDAQRVLLEDKFVLWDRASREGSMELRDYNRRAAAALKVALGICAGCGCDVRREPRPLAPESPFPLGLGNNCKSAGWDGFFAGKDREDCPFPANRQDLQRGWREGWDAASATKGTAV